MALLLQRQTANDAMKNSDDFQVVPLPKSRRAIQDMLREGKRKHMVHGLLELDVTTPRRQINDHLAATGERLSFTAFVTGCLGQAVAENKMMHGYRNWRGQLVLFEDVDVNTQIERDVDGRKWVMPYIIRAADKKSLLELHQELRAAQARNLDGARELKQYEWYLMLPGFMRRIFWWALRRSPTYTREIAGTVGVTAIGMFGKDGGWGLPITTQTLLLTLGGIAQKPGVVDGRIAIREYLDLTISFDHDIIDGAPAARFTRRLKELVEGGYGLDDVSAG